MGVREAGRPSKEAGTSKSGRGPGVSRKAHVVGHEGGRLSSGRARSRSRWASNGRQGTRRRSRE